MPLININALGVTLGDPLFSDLSFTLSKADRIGLVEEQQLQQQANETGPIDVTLPADLAVLTPAARAEPSSAAPFTTVFFDGGHKCSGRSSGRS